MKKRLLALNLVLVLLLTLVPTVSFADGPVVLVPDENGNACTEYYVNEGSDLTTEFKFTPSQTGIYTLSIQQPQAQPVSGESLMLYRTGENAEVISFSLNENADATRCVLEAGTEYTFSVQNNCAGQHLLSISFIEAAEYVEPIAIDSEIFPDEISRNDVTRYDINHNGMLEADELVCVDDLWICVDEDYVNNSISWIERFVYTKNISIYSSWECEVNITQLPTLPKTIERLEVRLGNLSSLPDLSVYTNLIELDCRNNKLTELPNLPENLRYLDCSENKLTSLPALPDCLTYIDFSDNLFTSFPSLPNGIQYFNCENMDLPSLQSLAGYIELEGFGCGNCGLSELPELPQSIQLIGCAYNELETLPKFSDYPNLKTIDCNYCNLSELTSLPASLELLLCEGNRLTQLPDLSGCVNLAALWCEMNELTELPPLPDSIQEVYCWENNITSFPDMNNCKNLIHLSCSNNKLAELPDLSGCTSLTELFCGNNEIASINALPPCVYSFDISNNQLKKLPSLAQYEMLTFVNLNNNSLYKLPELPDSVGILDFSGNNLTSIELNPNADYVYIDVSNNCLPSKEAVTGQNIVWNEENFVFGEQRVAEVHTHTTETVNYIAPTCTEDGYTGDEVCTVCGETVSTGEVIAATGHSYGDDNTCDNCGHKQSVSEAIQTWISDTIQSIRNFFDKIFGRG